MANEDYKELIEQHECTRLENEHLRDALAFYATDGHPSGWVAIHALQFAGTDRYIFQESAKESKDE